MTTQLSSLRVTADLDASGYTAGANQKVAADTAMTASSRAVAASMTDTATKVSQSGDVLAQLSRRFVDGYGTAEKFDSAMRRLASGVDTGKISITQTGPILDGIYRKYGQTADAASFSARGQAELGLAVAAANSRFVAAKPAVEGHSSALGIGNTQTMALMHATRSFGEQMAMGIPITQAMTSELNHLTFAMQGEDGLLAALKKVGPGILAALATPGVGIGIGIAAALIGITGYAIASRESIRSVDDILKDHDANIRALKDAYGDASAAAIAYGQTAANEGRTGLAIPAAMNEREIRLALMANSMDASHSMMANSNGLIGGSQMGPTLNSQFKDFSDEIEKYRSSVAKGTPDVLALRKAVTDKWDLDRNNEELTKEASAIFKLTDAAAKLQLALPGAKAALDALNNGRYPSFADIQPRQDYQDQNSAGLTWLQRQNKAAMDNIGATSPDERRQAAIDAESAKPSPDGQSAEVTQYKINAAGALAYAQALNSLEVAQEQNRRQLDQTIASAKTNLDLVGKSTAEIEAQKMETSELAKVREDAARNGIDDEKQFQAIYGETIAKIKETAAEYGKLVALQQAKDTVHGQEQDLELQRAEISAVGMNKLAHDALIESLKTEQKIRNLGADAIGGEADKLRTNTAAAAANAEALAHASMQANLMFERSQILRNSTDQAIASAQQSAGLPVDLNSAEAQMMKYNMALQETKDTFKGFFSDMQSSLEQGKSLWESFGDAAKNALTKIADKLLDRSLDTIFNSLFGGASGSTGSNGGGLLSQLFNFGGGGGSSQQSTPTGGASSFLGNLFGGSGSQSVGSMQVQAAVVNVNGGIGSGIPGLGGVPGAANDNGGGLFGWLGSLFGGSGAGSTGTGASQDSGLGGIFSPAGGFASSTGGAASALSFGGGSVTDMIRRAASAEGINPDIFLQVAKSEGGLSGFTQSNVFKDGIREPSFGPMQLLKGGPGTGFPTGLGNAFQQQTGLDPADPANMEAGINFAAQQAKQSGWGQWYGAKAAGIGNWEGINRGADGIDSATTQSISKLADASAKATDSIGSLGSGASSLLSSVGGAAGDATKGLGQFSSALNQFPAAPSGGGGGGGLFGWIGSLFGGGGGGGPLSPEASSLLQAYPDGGGLFDSGGYTGPGGRKEAAGIVHRGEVVWSQDDISRAGGVHVVEGMRRGYAGYADGGIVRSRMRYDGTSSPRQSASHSPANDGPAQTINQTINYNLNERPMSPASQNQNAAKNARALERLQRTA